MSRAPSEAESWKRMVLRAMPPPAWLGIDAPHMDVVLSSRCRIMRNLRGRRFPHLAEPEEAQEIAAEILQAARESGFGFDIHKRLSPAEREHLVGCRLISPDFGWQEVGRAVLLDSERAACVMVNEEDHLRVQALTAGWSLSSAEQKSESALDALGANLQFAWSPRFGFLSASPFNAGTGRRLSAMFHLIGLASSRRLSSVIRALSSRGIVARGLFGESSRAVGAFVQVSATNVGLSDFLGACEYLRREERLARQALG
ncbi:MAG TPA: hypothetical protein VM328_11390, partial [Fimbriimonadaceae bacterium]|nr:hypothetical protein [Fimbriimonadaceae bacterium]